jgi:hypothetical protein
MRLVDLLPVFRWKRRGLSAERRAQLDLVDVHYRERNAMAAEWDLPRAWVVCPTCGEQDWVLPPHGMEPCPLVTQMAEGMGIKIDAERNMALRTSVSIEEMAKQLLGLTGEYLGTDEEEEDE